MTIPAVAFVAKSSISGKTTLIEKVIREGKARGWRIGVLKHDVHNFEIDIPGKDSWRHAQAGADLVAISSPQKLALSEKVDQEKRLDEVLDKIEGVDIIFIEGYKRENKPKIEIFRSDIHQKLWCAPEQLLAVASDIPLEVGVPCYDLNDAKGICDLLEKTFL